MIDELINGMALIIWFIVTWISGFAFHEICHALECKRGGGTPEIKFWAWKGIPSMMCTCSGSVSKLFYYAGGIYSGLVMLLLSGIFFFIYMPLFISLFIVGLVNLVYGFYEGNTITKIPRDAYMLGKNIIYTLTIIIGIILLRNYIWGWIV